MSEPSDDEQEAGVLVVAKDAFLQQFGRPIRKVTSKGAQRAYLSTLLVFITGGALLFTAVVAYVVFYFSYVPSRGIYKPIYLQFGPNHHPYGHASLTGSLVSYQPYDVTVVLHMPRTASNKAAGNFMVDLRLLAPGSILDAVMEDDSNLLAKSSRPAILKYQSTLMEMTQRGAALPLHLVGWRDESEIVKIPMIEGVEFPKGWRNIPDQVRVELRSVETLQIYDAKVEITAKLRGLRYFMFKFRITSFFLLTSIFWMTEAIVAAIVWFSLSSYLTPIERGTAGFKQEHEIQIKEEEKPIKHEEDMSDTPHTFPTLSGQPPLRYSSPQVKQEHDEELSTEHQTRHGDQADDEEDDDGAYIRDDFSSRGFTDSGIGTSMESSTTNRPGGVRRRKSKGLGD